MTHLIHFVKSPLFHLFQRANLTCFHFACKVDFAISTLTHLGNDVELLNAQFGPALAKNDPLSA
jgi:hypothetical protein